MDRENRLLPSGIAKSHSKVSTEPKALLVTPLIAEDLCEGNHLIVKLVSSSSRNAISE
jgi:hypothetical protein